MNRRPSPASDWRKLRREELLDLLAGLAVLIRAGEAIAGSTGKKIALRRQRLAELLSRDGLELWSARPRRPPRE